MPRVAPGAGSCCGSCVAPDHFAAAAATRFSAWIPIVSVMQMPTEWLDEATQVLMTERHAQRAAPVVLWGAVLSLAGRAKPTSLMAQMDTSAQRTE